MIKSVDGDNSVGAVNKLINGMLARDSRAFREYVKNISPDMDMKYEYEHETGEKEVINITLGVGFFWPS
jgi:hypothetical protein